MVGRDQSSAAISVAVVDAQPATVAGIIAWCAAACPPIEVLAVGSDMAPVWTGPGAGADVVVMDLMLSDATPAFSDLRRLVDAGRRVIVYSRCSDDRTMVSCLEIGAFTYLTKDEGDHRLVAAIQAAARNQPYTSPQRVGVLGCAVRPRLTPRELHTLLLWFRCASKDTVATRMGVSINTVNTYLDRIRIKYANVGRSAATKAALQARAIQDGLIGLDEL